MDFDRFTAVLLVTPEHPPQLTEEEAGRLQDAHLAHLAALHDRGVLLAAGPVGSLDEPRRQFRGLSVLACGPEEARRLKQEDPAVRAGVFDLVALPWLVPAGALVRTDAVFPRSADDV